MTYKFLDHTADVLFEATGNTLAELCTACALALQEIQVRLSTVSPKRKKVVKITAPNPDRLLFSFLQELIFIKDANQRLFSKFKISIKEKNGFTLTADCFGEKINMKKHKLNVDAKAITLHQFEVKKTSRGWKARVIVDI